MFKYDFFSKCDFQSKEDMTRNVCEFISDEYGINFNSILAKMNDRERIGSVEVDEGFFLPHIEYSGDLQGLVLVNYELNKKKYTSLFMIVNVTKINAQLEKILTTCLNKSGMNELRNCDSQKEFEKIIKEMS